MMQTKVKISEEELVALIKGNSESGFSYLYDNYSAALYGVIFRIVNDADRSNDVLQDTFVKIWKNKDSYDTSKGTIFTWMLNIARNSAIDSNRSKHVKYKIQIDERVVDNESSVNESYKSDNIGLKETVDKLKPEYKLVVEYIYLQGYTQQEFSDKFEIPLGTVKTRTRAALQELRKLLN
ncbi:MAG: sigma-70 family RNA polymerase sigma factor [Bacteroidota bacterium]